MVYQSYARMDVYPKNLTLSREYLLLEKKLNICWQFTFSIHIAHESLIKKSSQGSPKIVGLDQRLA